MKVKSKRLLALMLAASMVTANLGTAFAQNLGKPSITKPSKTATVTLNANGGAFVGSPSDATPPDATAPDASASNAEKEIKVELYERTHGETPYYYTYWYNVQDQLDMDGITNEMTNSGYEFDCWTAKKNDFSTEVTGNDLLFSDTTVYANWKKEAVNNSSIADIYASGLGEGQTLTINDLENEKTVEELMAALKSNTLGFKKMIEGIEPIQLDIKPSAGYVKGTPVKITMPVPNGMAGYPIAIVHFTSEGKAEIIVPTINGNEMSFILTSFSPVVIMAAERDCKVKVEPSKGGYTIACTTGQDEKTGKRTITYLPVGEDVTVPYNTVVSLEAVGVEEAEEWYADFDKTTITKGNRTDIVYDDLSDVLITGDTVISTDFVKRFYSSDPEEEEGEVKAFLRIDYEYTNAFEAGSKASTSLEADFHDGKAKTDVTTKTVFKLPEDQYNFTDNADFEINGNVLTSKEPLESGLYRVEVEGNYTDSKGKIYRSTRYITFHVGTRFSLNVYFATVKDEYYDDVTIVSDNYHSMYTSATTFKAALDECEKYMGEQGWAPSSEIRMYNYERAGWYQYSNGKVNSKVTDDTKLYIGNNDFYLRFKKGDKFYEAKVDKLPDSDTPLPPDPDDDDNNGGNGGHGGNGGGSGSRSSGSGRYSGTSNMSGSWKSDANGWWFQKTDGSYAKSEWGMLNGKWYWFNEDGYMATGWVFYNGRWYYMDDASGAMTTSSWILKDGKWYYLTGDGGMLANQWFLYKGAWYYLDGNGAMMTNGTTPDGYQVNGDGVWVQ